LADTSKNSKIPINGQLKVKPEMENRSHLTPGLERKRHRGDNQQCSQQYLPTAKSNSTARRRRLPVKARQDGRPRRRSEDFNYVRYRSTRLMTIDDDQRKWPTTVYNCYTAVHCLGPFSSTARLQVNWGVFSFRLYTIAALWQKMCRKCAVWQSSKRGTPRVGPRLGGSAPDRVLSTHIATRGVTGIWRPKGSPVYGDRGGESAPSADLGFWKEPQRKTIADRTTSQSETREQKATR